MAEVPIDDILATVRRLVRDRVVPAEAEIEETDAIPDDLRRMAKEMGLFGFTIDEKYGGLGLSVVDEARVVMELGYTSPAFRSMFGTNNGIAGHVLLLGATDEQRAEYLPKLASGEWTASFALTEPEAGSDPSSIRTTAYRTGDGWVIDGSKRFITNAPLADVFFVFARIGDDAGGISTFLVERGTPGVTVGPKDRKMGQAGAWTADVGFDGVVVGPDALIGGEPGHGLSVAMRCLAHGRIHIGALCVGLAERLVDESVAYATSRTQSGRPIADFQLVQGLIADSYTDYLAAHGVVMEAARRYEAGTDVRIAPSAAKYFASEAVFRVADRAVQIHGGSGYMRGNAVERLFRDARLFRLYEGTSQIQQVIIARELGRAARRQPKT
ncbi:acyl-CoA dehydrogenase family protein [Amycolatopsis pithecellobii]|uniref:acyl-CoA dehydrogenase family protein n=1 Tax=Amycolatopsis pithecellobii TaxID=664692 RepID=UPI0028A7FDC2|nr:acyl-CoA dehydrogenase family protein [Amycolatopsis pithecellobii]